LLRLGGGGGVGSLDEYNFDFDEKTPF